MKKLVLFLSLIMVSFLTFGQTTLSQDEFNKLPIEVQNQIKSVQERAQTEAKIETAGKWVGFGKEVGTAVNESLMAVTKTATEFSKTGLGKLTIGLVVWKVVGTDILQIIFGVIWIILITFIALFIHFKYAKPTKVLREEIYNPETKKYDRKWQIFEGSSEYKNTAIIILIIGYIIAIPIMFV